MGRSIRRWCGLGVLVLLLNLSGEHQALSTEVWNIGNSQRVASAQASAQVLDGVITGFQAFRAAEVDGIEARKKLLTAAADQLDAAQKSMVTVLKGYSEDPISKGTVTFDSVPQESQLAIKAWLATNDT